MINDAVEDMPADLDVENRGIGIEHGRSRELFLHHPFPESGRGVRVVAEARWEYLEPLKKAEDILISELSGLPRVVSDILGKPPAACKWA